MSDKDDYIKVLDFLERGRSGDKDEPVAQGVGTENFTLLEVVMREGEQPRGGEELYIGEGDRDRVEFIKARIKHTDLTATAKNELEYVLEDIVRNNEERFVEFYNEATPVTPRRHAFELLPGVGTKNRDKLIETRESKKFESFEDIGERVGAVSDPVGLIVQRIIQEMKGEAKRKLFT